METIKPVIMDVLTKIICIEIVLDKHVFFQF